MKNCLSKHLSNCLVQMIIAVVIMSSCYFLAGHIILRTTRYTQDVYTFIIALVVIGTLSISYILSLLFIRLYMMENMKNKRIVKLRESNADKKEE